ncbi:MAG TPA: class II aldolase/adducin family protein [Candidatus Blautia faecipullorum]|nr:class II aldolase/adducin family protein [Candidatus Blautia faecipullorum]
MNEIQKKYEKQINEMVEVCIRDGELGYGASVGGNLSYRVEENLVLITPTKTPKRKLTFDMICAVDMDGNTIFAPEGKKPTGEAFMHLHIMKMRPDIKAVMHAHPPVCIGMSTSREGKESMMLPLIPEAMMMLGPVITIPYAEPNAKALGYVFDPYVNDANAYILENHGVVSLSAKGALETIEMIQIMESMAESIVAAKQMGGPLLKLSEKDISDLDEVICQLGWRLPGAPGRYRSLKDAFIKKN